ncbi:MULTISPECIES: DNA gyrase subunit A [Sphingomonas]|uniref:DNA gyrase subunit A n=1 Tax=Sphingomonas TaxID=13687 RepID=UPI0006F1FB3D|nr:MULTISPECIES: DNA gyrase subunit A [Sphingomonas]KQM91648.1 DNA gyrase subunit A [Sphingomonas sp. Leaf226]MBD8734219.1 DNA gyrase subunit A [Sphingomonas sp. CFBP 13706]MBP2512484.1 DNA gyrase subunit A [Sphingomonas sp. PvP018]MDY0967226.1 DNA gyrase subunit A [Sphingomonas sp. CFBP9021]NII59544.1 DNA gyrase subunit A [Sphingomonas aerolata]
MTDETMLAEPTGGEPAGIATISIVDEMKSSYLDYAMSVIVARALPDVRDGLKPVHRRILYGAHESGFVAGKPYRKSARIVGDVMGKYHPHGDSSIYDALARMTQDWSMRVPLIDGQGNFGSMDPDPPAAMRYTEARLGKVANALLGDLDKDTVDFTPNYDGSEREPSVLPARFPNLLVNGAGGIAVGMATNIPPHNLGEVIAACLAYMDNGAITTEELFEIVPGPDFPTGAIILGRAGAKSAYETGRGSIIVRSRHVVEEGKGDRRSIVLTEIPFQTGKNGLVEKIAEAAKDKRIEGVSDIRDESSRMGVRIVIDLKRDATPDVVLNQLWRHTPAQSSFPANMLAIRGGRPELLNLRDIIGAFITFREQVITRRSKFELAKARERAHLLLGLVIAVTNLDEVVRIIRGSSSPAEARGKLLAREWPVAEIAPYIALVEAVEDKQQEGIYKLSEPQVRAILDLRLHRLTALGRDEIGDELKTLAASIAELLHILADRAKLYEVMRGELIAIRDEFATPRRSEIAAAANGIDDEDLIEREDMVVTVTMQGYIKRTSLDTFRAQARGGKGRAGMSTKDEDVVTELFVTSTHTPVLFFSNLGKVYRYKVWRLPEGGPATRGRPMINLLPLAPGETISTVLPLPEDLSEWSRLHVMFATQRGLVRRNAMDAFTNVPSNGKIAMRFEEGSEDKLIGVALLTEHDDVLLATRLGKAIRFAGDDVREFQSRTSTGVRGVTLKGDDEVISLSVLHRVGATPEERETYLKFAPWKGEREGDHGMGDERYNDLKDREQFILTVCENGYGKLSSAYDYRRTGRGGQGITNIDNIARNGQVVASFAAAKGHQLMLVTNQAKLIRTTLASLRVISRNSAGVKLFDVAKGEHVVSAARIEETEEDAEVNLADATPELAPDTGATIGEDTAAGDPTEGQGDGE